MKTKYLLDKELDLAVFIIMNEQDKGTFRGQDVIRKYGDIHITYIARIMKKMQKIKNVELVKRGTYAITGPITFGEILEAFGIDLKFSRYDSQIMVNHYLEGILTQKIEGN